MNTVLAIARGGDLHGPASLPRPRAPAVPGAPPRILVVRAPYYREVVDGLGAGAARILDQARAVHDVADVAGAFELPAAIRIALDAETGYDGFVALGCVVRGETDHYDYICASTMQGLMAVAVRHGLALGAGLLTVETLAQAEARAGDDGHNRGAEAAVACLLQVALRRNMGIR